MLRTKLRSYLFLSLLLLVSASCAGPPLTSRVVQQDSSRLVRLDFFQYAGSSSGRYEHPSSWTEEELSAILAGLLLEEHVGLMDSSRPPRSVFSREEIEFLAPVVRAAFEKASSNEWIAFLLIEPRGAEVVATSGGMFVSDARLHLVLANHRALLAQDSEEVGRVRANPFYSVNGSGGALGFESSHFVMGTG